MLLANDKIYDYVGKEFIIPNLNFTDDNETIIAKLIEVYDIIEGEYVDSEIEVEAVHVDENNNAAWDLMILVFRISNKDYNLWDETGIVSFAFKYGREDIEDSGIRLA